MKCCKCGTTDASNWITETVSRIVDTKQKHIHTQNEAEENKIVIFDSDLLHRGVVSNNSDFRWIINFIPSLIFILFRNSRANYCTLINRPNSNNITDQDVRGNDA